MNNEQTLLKNKKLVTDFIELCYNQHKVEKSARKYLKPDYIQHNPVMGDGQDAFIKYFSDFMKKTPKLAVNIVRVIAENDLVTLHINAKMEENDRGLAVVDIFRIEDDMVAEHWDIQQEVPEKSENDNTMF